MKKTSFLIGLLFTLLVLVSIASWHRIRGAKFTGSVLQTARQIPSWNLVNPTDTYTFTTQGSEAFITCGPPPSGMRMSTIQEATTWPLAKIYEYQTSTPTIHNSYIEANRSPGNSTRWSGRKNGYGDGNTLTELSAGKRYYIRAGQPTGFWCWQSNGTFSSASSSSTSGRSCSAPSWNTDISVDPVTCITWSVIEENRGLQIKKDGVNFYFFPGAFLTRSAHQSIVANNNLIRFYFIYTDGRPGESFIFGE
jgi:hypothetical protein